MIEKQRDNSLAFLDALVEKIDLHYYTSMYRKPTFSGQYTHWNSFSPEKNKIALIHTLVHSVLTICSEQKLDGELDNIKRILASIGFPDHVVVTSQKNYVVQQALWTWSKKTSCLNTPTLYWICVLSI